MATRQAKNERLAVLNNAEQEALYGLPDFGETRRRAWKIMMQGTLIRKLCTYQQPTRQGRRY